MTRVSRCLLVALASATFGPLAVAAPITLQGEVVDPAMYLKSGQRGAESENTTYEAVDGGQTLALLDEEHHALYLLLAEEPGEDPNELVYDFVNKKINATGEVYERDGLKGLVLKTAEPVTSPAAAPATPAAPAQTAAPATPDTAQP